jgi:hypothetical protein
LKYGLVNDKDILGRMFKTYKRCTQNSGGHFWLKKLYGRFKSSSRLPSKKNCKRCEGNIFVQLPKSVAFFSFYRKCSTILSENMKYNEILVSVNAGYFLDYLE